MTLFRLRRIVKTVLFLVAVIALIGGSIRLCLTVLYAPLSESTAHFVEKSHDPDRSVTVLNLPLSIPLSDLREAAERYTPIVYKDVDLDFTDMLLDDSLSYDLERGSISMDIEGNGIRFSFPVTGLVRARGLVNLGMMKIKTSAHAEVAGTISGRLAFDILPDWRIKPDVDYRVDITKALIPIKGVGDISLRSFLEDKLSRKIKRRKKKLTDKIMSKEIIRNRVEKVWKSMHRVRAISDDPKVWARVVPKTVGFMPLVAQGAYSLKIGISMTLGTELVVSSDPPPVEVGELPDAEILGHLKDDFRLYVPVFADMAALNNTIMTHVGHKNLPMGKGFNVSITRADLVSPGNNRLSAVVFARFHHDTLGLATECRLYLHGRLDYETESGVIRYTDVSYDAVFSRPLVSAVHWVMAPWLRHRIETRMSFFLAPELAKAHDAINQWIETLVVPPGVSPSLDVDAPELLSLTADRKGLSAEVLLRGHISATLDFPDKAPVKKE